MLKIIRRLEEEKKALENVNISAKGSASEQSKIISELTLKIEGVSRDNRELTEQLSEKQLQL